MSINQNDFLALLPPDEPSKIARVLHRLCCGAKFTRFDAEKQLNDHVLNTTISDLANDYGMNIAREWVTVPGYQGNPTRCCRYSIISDPENLESAYRLLKSWGYREPPSGGISSLAA